MVQSMSTTCEHTSPNPALQSKSHQSDNLMLRELFRPYTVSSSRQNIRLCLLFTHKDWNYMLLSVLWKLSKQQCKVRDSLQDARRCSKTGALGETSKLSGIFFKATDAEYGTQVPQNHIFVFPPWKDDLSSLGSRQVRKTTTLNYWSWHWSNVLPIRVVSQSHDWKLCLVGISVKEIYKIKLLCFNLNNSLF